jgi:hypothetical protein
MFLQMLHALFRSGTQIIKSAKDDRFCWTNFGASGHESALLSIVTKGAFECAAGLWQRLRTSVDHAEWTRDHAIAASITHIILHENGAGFSANNRPRRTRFQAAGFFAMLTDIRKKNPAKRILAVAEGRCTGDLASFLSILFQEHHVAPGRRAKVAGVVVRISSPREAVIGHMVPFFARDFASLAADAYSRIGEETDFHVFLHVIVPSLIRAVCAFADHRLSIFPSKP